MFYKKGDATEINSDKNVYILHICNNIGKWGVGFTKAIDQKWQQPRIDYENFISKYLMEGYSKTDLLGKCIFTYMTDYNQNQSICIVSMIAQNGVRNKNNSKPIDYNALELCLKNFNGEYLFHGTKNSIIQMPYIGCGLAGGDWFKIEPLIQKWVKVPTYVYEL